MAKKSNKTYQIILQNPEDQPFVKRLLEIYGYQESEVGVFSETIIAEATKQNAAKKRSSTKPDITE